MKNKVLTLAASALVFGAMQFSSFAGCDYVYGGGGYCDTGDGGGDCCFSYDYIDVAYMYSNYGSAVAPNVLAGAVQNAPNGSIVDQMKGVDVQFVKSIGCDFYIGGEFYNTDGFLSDSIVNANPAALRGKRGEFYYYRLGLGVRHSAADNLDVTFEAGGLYTDCRVPSKNQDEWGWYIAPGIRYCMNGLGEVYFTYSYENYETMANHRFDGGVILPLPCSDSMSLKLGGRYETEFEKSSVLAGLRFEY